MKIFNYTWIIILILVNIFELTRSMDISNSSKMLLGATSTFEVQQGCHEIIIPNNFKKLVMNLNSENLDAFLITDSKIENCREIYDLSECCSKNSTFCIENKNPSKNDFNLNYCIRSTYLYACKLNPDTNSTSRILQEDTTQSTDENLNSPNNTNLMFNNSDSSYKTYQNNSSLIQSNSGPGIVTIDLSIIKDEGCQTAEFIPEVACSTLGLQNCKDPNFCSDRCVYVECRTEMENPNAREFSMCLPYNLTENDITNRCRNHITFSDSQPYVYKKYCERNPNDQSNNEFIGISSHSFFKLLVFIMGVFVILLFIASVYYRFSKKYNDDIPPFEAPSYIPNFIFPK